MVMKMGWVALDGVGADAALQAGRPSRGRHFRLPVTAAWARRAVCSPADLDVLFAEGAAQNEGRVVCQPCPVRVECLVEALDSGVEFGVWGGLTERDRRRLVRRHPEVRSWRAALAAPRPTTDTPVEAGGDADACTNAAANLEANLEAKVEACADVDRGLGSLDVSAAAGGSPRSGSKVRLVEVAGR